ncbi:MAG: metal ABC transporter permease [Firmicutes bacterium]|nr:metal ABC transporter permease [Bacillota bacterium]
MVALKGKGGIGSVDDIFSFIFMQRALIASVMIGVLCSTVSVLVVLKRLSFLSVGLSHSALGGIAIGLVTGVNPMLTGILFAITVALASGLASYRRKISEDTAIGIMFSAGMGLGILLISLARGYYPELFSLLFGNILAVTSADLYLLGAVTAVVLLFIGFFMKELLAICFDEEMAFIGGIPVMPLYLSMLVAMAVTIMVSVKIAGVVLASALLVIPAATGYRLSNNYRGMLVTSLVTGLIGCIGGLVLSYFWDIPSGATIVLVMTALFLFSGFKKNRDLPGTHSDNPPPHLSRKNNS